MVVSSGFQVLAHDKLQVIVWMDYRWLTVVRRLCVRILVTDMHHHALEDIYRQLPGLRTFRQLLQVILKP